MACWLQAVLSTLGFFGAIGLLVGYIMTACILTDDYGGWPRTIGIIMFSLLGCAIGAFIFGMIYIEMCK